MEYSNLSRETLIHEIRQLNKTIDQLKFSTSTNQTTEMSYLNHLPFSVLYISSEYSILWANRHASETYEKLYLRKCYQALYGFGDICPDCPYKEVVHYKTPMHVDVSEENAVWSNLLMPIKRENEADGILEFVMPHQEKTKVVENYKATIAEFSQENQELKRKMGTLNDFIKNYSRKLLTPIKALKGVHLLLEKTYLSETQAEYLKVLENNSQLLFDLFSRTIINYDYNDQRAQFQKEEFDLKRVFEKLVSRSKSLGNGKAITLNQEQILPRILKGDELNFSTALNLLVDAAISTVPSSHLYIDVTEVSESLKRVNLKVTLSNRSDYNGISTLHDEEEEGYYSAIEAYSKQTALTIAAQIIEGFGGSLNIFHMDSRGVHVMLFISFDKVIPKGELNVSSLHQSKAGILIIDEERPPVSLEMFDMYNIYFAKTLEQALSLFKEYRPTLTLINIMLIDQDGFKIFDELERYKDSNQYILSMSNQLIENERSFMKDYGFDDYFAKPIDQQTLVKIFRTYLPKY
jgi:CheY-like chemotaxis protein/nitrogen-specific signal transduction histidine kinase